MNYMLDTNMLIYLLKHQPATVAERVSQLAASDTLCMSFVTWAELLKGAEQSQRRVEVTRQLGTPIGGNDLWIASHALAESCTLVTNNVREFSRIEGLIIENWVA